MRILGLDPSLTSTGWGIIEVNGNRLQYVADGFIPTNPQMPIEKRLEIIFKTLCEVIETYQPQEAAIEKTFLNANPETSLKLSMARGVVVLAPGHYDIPLYEFEPNKVKKALVGVGHADKKQIQTMIKILLPGCNPKNNDSADALAMAVTRSHYRTSVGGK